MNRFLLLILLIVFSLLCFTGYGLALTDWIQDISTGFYIYHYLEAIVETLALWAYTYLGLRFMRGRIRFL